MPANETAAQIAASLTARERGALLGGLTYGCIPLIKKQLITRVGPAFKRRSILTDLGRAVAAAAG